MNDTVLKDARAVVEQTIASGLPRPLAKTIFDETTFTATHVLYDPSTHCAIVNDSVMDFDQPSGKTNLAWAGQAQQHWSGFSRVCVGLETLQ
jgi:hypothetical protein